MKRWSLVLVEAGLLALAWCCLAAMPAAALDYLHPQINAKGVMVWHGYDGAHWQIYRWDPKVQTAVNISLSDYNSLHTQINAKGVVAWRGYDGAHWQIYRWDPKAQSAVNISQRNYDNDNHQINAQGVVIWRRL